MNNKALSDRMGTQHFLWVVIHLMPSALSFFKVCLGMFKKKIAQRFFFFFFLFLNRIKSWKLVKFSRHRNLEIRELMTHPTKYN